MQLAFDFSARPLIELGPLGLRPKRGKPIPAAEIRALYVQLGDIKRVAITLKIHERRVRPLVRDLMQQVRDTQWARRPRSRRALAAGIQVLEVPIGTRWRCACCGVTVVITEAAPLPVCPAGTRAPWLPSANPFTAAERWPDLSTRALPIDA